MEPAKYRDLIAQYIVRNFSSRGVGVYTEVNLGTSVIGKRRRVDLVVLVRPALIQVESPASSTDWARDAKCLAIECKFQDVSGTADEKIPYALEDLSSLRVPGCLVYAGKGWSEGVLHLLRSHHLAAFCHPRKSLQRAGLKKGDSVDAGTWQLDHVLAATFGWWDLVLDPKKRMKPAAS